MEHGTEMVLKCCWNAEMIRFLMFFINTFQDVFQDVGMDGMEKTDELSYDASWSIFWLSLS